MAVCGATCDVTIDDQAADQWRTLRLAAGQELSLGVSAGPGLRNYVAIGGLLGRACRAGLARYLYDRSNRRTRGAPIAVRRRHPFGRRSSLGASLRVKCAAIPVYEHDWVLEAMRGPQADPDYMTTEDMAEFFSKAWTVSPQSSRTGIRLEPHKFHWARNPVVRREVIRRTFWMIPTRWVAWT